MKKTLLALTALLLLGMAQGTMAQQKKTSVRKTMSTVKKKTSVVTPISITDPVVIDGHLAYMGVQLGQSPSKIWTELEKKGFKEVKSDWGDTQTKGLSYGAMSAIGVDEKGNVYVTEDKAYTLSQAKRRVASLAAGLKKALNGKTSVMPATDGGGGGTAIACDYGRIELQYQNDDEVEFISDTYVVRCHFIDGATGPYPSTITEHWLKPEPASTYTEAYIFQSCEKGQCEIKGEENTACHGYIFIYNEETGDESDTYYVLNYVGEHPNGHIFDAICKSRTKKKAAVTGRILLHATGDPEVGANLTIKALTDNLKGSQIDNITMQGSPF